MESFLPGAYEIVPVIFFLPVNAFLLTAASQRCFA